MLRCRDAARDRRPGPPFHEVPTVALPFPG